jgi:hypothetical protein
MIWPLIDTQTNTITAVALTTHSSTANAKSQSVFSFMIGSVDMNRQRFNEEILPLPSRRIESLAASKLSRDSGKSIWGCFSDIRLCTKSRKGKIVVSGCSFALGRQKIELLLSTWRVSTTGWSLWRLYVYACSV